MDSANTVLVGREPHLPYDRPPLSKGYLRGSEAVDDALMQEAGWYEEQDIEVRFGVGADALTGRQVDDVGVQLAAGLGEPPHSARRDGRGRGERPDVA